MRASALALGLLALLSSCRRKHVPVAPRRRSSRTPPARPTPARGWSSRASSARRPTRWNPDVTERFSLEDRGCLRAFIARQDWHMNVSEVEGASRPPGHAPAGVEAHDHPRCAQRRRRGGHSVATSCALPRWSSPGEAWVRPGASRSCGERPTVVIGPGRGLLSVWIRRANLGVGERVRRTRSTCASSSSGCAP